MKIEAHSAERTSTAEDVKVAAWRRGQLLAAGFNPALADELAQSRRVNLHALIELVEHGCPPELVARILAPLD